MKTCFCGTRIKKMLLLSISFLNRGETDGQSDVGATIAESQAPGSASDWSTQINPGFSSSKLVSGLNLDSSNIIICCTSNVGLRMRGAVSWRQSVKMMMEKLGAGILPSPSSPAHNSDSISRKQVFWFWLKLQHHKRQLMNLLKWIKEWLESS